MALRTNRTTRMQPMAITSLAAWLLLLGGDTAGMAGDRLEQRAAGLIRTYCADCHSGDVTEAGVNLVQMVVDPAFGARLHAGL